MSDVVGLTPRKIYTHQRLTATRSEFPRPSGRLTPNDTGIRRHTKLWSFGRTNIGHEYRIACMTEAGGQMSLDSYDSRQQHAGTRLR